MRLFARARGESSAFADWLSGHDPSQSHLAHRLLDCGRFVEFTEYADGAIRLSGGHTCKQLLLCRLCALRRCAKLTTNYSARVRSALDADPSLRPYLVTLTVRSGTDLAKSIFHLRESLRRFHARRKDHLRGRRGWTEAARVAGAVGSVDPNCWNLKTWRPGEPFVWHPHAHEIWLCASPPDVKKLSREWRDVTGDSFVVDVRPVGTPDAPADAPAQHVRNALSYAARFAWMPKRVRWEAYQSLRAKTGRLPRLLTSCGVLRGSPSDDEAGDGPVAFARALYSWGDEAGGYGEPLLYEVPPPRPPVTPCHNPAPAPASELPARRRAR